MENERYLAYGFETSPVDTYHLASPSLDMVRTITKHGGKSSDFSGWYAIPNPDPITKRISQAELLGTEVNVHKMLEFFLSDPRFVQTLRTMDFANGCGRQCGTCLADSCLPSKTFDVDSYLSLLSDKRFIARLQPDSLRIGSSGDIQDLPFAPEIILATILATEELDYARKKQNPDHRHFLHVLTSYTPRDEASLDQLIDIAKKYPHRIVLCISLPYNTSDILSRKFVQYVKDRPDVFRQNFDCDRYGNYDPSWNAAIQEGIHVQDVRHFPMLFGEGRTLDPNLYLRRSNTVLAPQDRDSAYISRGMAKVYLNPEGLWLMGYVTPEESHTNRVFTLINEKNIDSLCHLPYHPDFPTPPNWPGGSGKTIDKLTVQVIRKHADRKKFHPFRIVK